MNDIKDIAILGDEVWAVSDGGAFTYNKLTKDIRKWTNTDGLKSVNLTAIEIDNHSNIIFGGKEGFIQVYNHNTQDWTDLSFEGLAINDLIVVEDTIWVSTENKDLPGKTIATFIWKNGEYAFNDFFVNFPEIVTSINKIAIYNNRVWLATEKGLLSAKSDFTTFTLSDPQNWTLHTTANGLPSDEVLSLVTFDDKLWCGTSSGLAHISRDNSILTDNILSGRSINILEKSSDELLIVSYKTLYHYLPGSGLQQNSNFSKTVNSISVDKTNSIWIGLSQGGIRNESNNISVTMDGPLPNAVRFVICDKNSRIWASSGKFKLTPNNGYSLYQNGIWTNYDFGGSGWGSLGNTDYIYQDRFENIWLGSWGGTLAVFDGEDYTYFHNHKNNGTRIVTTKDTVISQNLSPIADEYTGFFSGAANGLEDYGVITAFKEDVNGRFWIVNSYASNGNYLAVAPYSADGTISLDKDEWVYFGSSDGIASRDGISSIEFDDFGRVWIGTNGDGVYVLDYNNTYDDKSDDAIFFDRTINEALISDEISAIAKDNDGIMWIGTRGGIHSYDGQNTTRHFGETGPLNNVISQIIVDDYNNKWIATAGGLTVLKGGSSPFEPDAWITYTTENSGLLSNNVNSIFIDVKKSQALIGTESGLSIFSGSFAETQNSYDQVIAGPNPFILDEQGVLFTIKKLRNNSTIKILNLNGTLIQKLTAKNKQVDGSRATWNGKDLNGNRVASGIYLYMAFNEDGKSVAGKIAVIRK